MSITCKQLIEFIAAYVAGELDDGARTAFERHLDVCRSCQAYLDSYRKTMKLVQELATDEPLDDVPEELVATILSSRRS
jgi:anti-sigma factor RsiW